MDPIEETREMLEEVEALAMADVCPFLEGQPLYDELHVDVTDPECYGRVAASLPPLAAVWADECRACVREGLEERAIALKEATQG